MIRIFAICEGIRWTHLPVAGGLNDQNPEFVEKLAYMLAKKNEAEERRSKEQERRPGGKGKRR